MTVTQATLASDINAGTDARRTRRNAILGSAIGYATDGFDLLILGFMLRPISADLGLTQPQAASLVTATLFGAVLGGFGFGWLSDRLGRVRVLAWTIVLFAVFTGLCALSQGYWDLLAYRTIAGLGLGGEFGIGMALVAEACPASERARVSSYVGLGWQGGVLTAAILTPLLLPVIGWRGMFLLGILPAVAAYFIRRTLHEPEMFLREAEKRSPQSSFKLLVKDARDAETLDRHGDPLLGAEFRLLRRDDLAAELSVDAVRPRADADRGLDHGDDCRHGVRHLRVRPVSPIASAAAPAFFTYMTGAAIMVLVYSRLTDPTALLFAGMVMGFFVNGMLGGYGALMSELYPTAARATAQNVLFNIGRAVGGFGPLLVGFAAASHGFEFAISMLALLYVVDLVTMWLLIPERRGAELQ